jgi:hypothetical protein
MLNRFFRVLIGFVILLFVAAAAGFDGHTASVSGSGC